MVESVERDGRGILRPHAGLQRFRLDRRDPAPPLSRFIDRFWLTSWSLPPGETYTQRVLSHPVVDIVFHAGQATVNGPRRETFAIDLSGTGHALGILFRPAAFQPFHSGPLADRVLPLRDVLPALADVAETIHSGLSANLSLDELAAPAEEVLKGLIPDDHQPCENTRDWAELGIGDRSITQPAQLAEAVGVGLRTLQRAFQRDIGVGAQWLLRRYRIYEAAEAARRGPVDWAQVAVELGYADQSHLTRDFTAAIGESPAAYQRNL
ncbi:AraC family transcriptional regulator [Pseudonocardiaceae bacterium YIM PH 21723]|nr:AraC family transcriptional regulator [Pseudonocardiaceae bacterium YIM PH 21723]